MFKPSIGQYKDQDFSKLKASHSDSKLFEDPLFPADNSSLFYKKTPPAGIKWMRPKVFYHL